MVTDVVLQNMKNELSELQEGTAAAIDQLSQSKMATIDPSTTDVTESMEENPVSIFFKPPANSFTARAEFSSLLNSELLLRGVETPTGNLSSRRDQLKTHLVQEYRLRRLLREIDVSKRPQTALFLLLQAVPCILHLENRVGLKTLQILFNEGLISAVNKETHGHLAGENQRMQAYFYKLEGIVNTSILGSTSEPTQWQVPYDKTTKKLLPISFENSKTRRIMNQLKELVEVSVNDPEKQRLNLLPPYRKFMEKLRSKDDWNTEAELKEFQNNIETWFWQWVALHSAAGMTNYIHLLSSGHIAEYVHHWGNLYEHSQQGWEGMNALLKSVLFRRTSRGGGRKKSRLKPVARWLMRRMSWLFGLTKEKAESYLSDEAFVSAIDALGDRDNVEDDVYEYLVFEEMGW